MSQQDRYVNFKPRPVLQVVNTKPLDSVFFKWSDLLEAREKIQRNVVKCSAYPKHGKVAQDTILKVIYQLCGLDADSPQTITLNDMNCSYLLYKLDQTAQTYRPPPPKDDSRMDCS